MPQIWLKRNLYDGLVKRELNVEKKVDELVEDFLGIKEERKEKGGRAEKEDVISKKEKLRGLMKRRGER
ncbi:MAG: hypothetical protein MOIL_01567 [Candidatus Methanolliviera sp. GoM_oil]|nr:MAG: hypothetical protein MOIL_01567 [Candidatus Methanolliviera sp. GoM_oil]